MSKTSATEPICPPKEWSKKLRAEFLAAQSNGCVGQKIVLESECVRVWSIQLNPGDRIGFHRHVLDYFWTAVTPGQALSHYHDGRVTNTQYKAGDTKLIRFGPGEFMIHDLENTGDSVLLFTTVEFLDSANLPMPVPTHVYP